VLSTQAISKLVCTSGQLKCDALTDVLIETDEDGQRAMAMFEKLKIYSPEFKGPMSTEESVTSVLALVEKASIEGGYAGVFVSAKEGKLYI